MKQIYTLIALGAFALAGCSTDELTPLTPEGGGEASNSPVTIVASLNAPGTRTGHDEDDANDLSKAIHVTWAAGDKFVIHSIGTDGYLVANGTATFDLVADDAGKYSGKFTGTVAPVMNEDYDYDIFCPATVPARQVGVMNFSLAGQKQTGNNSLAHLSAVDVMRGHMVNEGDYTQISFVADKDYPESGHLAALMTFDLSNIPADLGEPKRIVLGAINVDGPVKDFYDNLAGSLGTEVETLTLDLENVTAAGGKIKAYMMMAPATIFEDEQLTITLEGSNKSYMFTSPAIGAAGKEYKRGMRYVAKVSGADSWKEAAAPPIEYDGSATASATFGGGDGTGEHGSATNPYLISTAGELQKLITDVNSGTNYENKYFKLTQDINITAPKWTPIGNSDQISNSKPFKGTFDGGGHTLSGTMTYARDTGGSGGFGFFGSITSATITNLHSTATVTGSVDNHTFYSRFVGSIVGNVTVNSIISNCTTKSGAMVSGKVFTGGVVGSIGRSNIIGCSNEATVTNNNDDSSGTGVGGIVGGQTYGTISSCFNTGTITNQYICPVGAIVGWTDNNCTIEHCRYLTGTLKAAYGKADNTFTDVASSANIATLNDATTIAALNLGITDWNAANPTKPVLPFSAGATLPVLAPPTTGGGAIGGIGDSGSAWK